MLTLLKKSVAVILVLLLGGLTIPAQDKFEPIPKEMAPRYRFDLRRNFFPSPEAELAARKTAYAMLEELEKLKGKVTSSADNLLQALELSDRAQAEFYRHTSYLFLRFAINTKDEASRNESSALGAELSKRVSFLQEELMNLDDQTLSRFLQQKPALKLYAFVIELARRYKPHTLSLKEEEMLREVGPVVRDWPAELFQRARDRTQFGTIHTAGGELDVYQQAREINNSPDRAVREAGFKKKYAGYAAHRDLYAFALPRLIKASNQLSRLRRYKDFADEVNFSLFLTSSEVKDLYEKIAQQAEFNKRLERARSAYIKKVAGLDDVNIWDMSVIPSGLQRPRFTILETTRILKEGLAPLGPEYAKELEALLDPANGRLDIVGGDNRVPGAFADGFLGNPISIFYSFNYEGYFDDVDALAHEAGHAVHFQLMGNNHVRPAYANGPNYFTEAYAMFNELLVIDYLYQREKDPLRRIYFLEQFLNYASYLFTNARHAAIEMAIHDAVGEGKLLSADEIDSVTKKVGARYSIWYEKHDEMKMKWIDIHHYYTVPMYFPNYVYAALLALKFYERYARDPQQFVPRYLAMMRNGFDAPPASLLKKFVDVDLSDPRLVADAIGVLKGRLDELEALYAK
ncbi:MAG TPA: M3 family metallopeptidase [Pyrinomonadaceae bacterium]